MFTVHKTDDGRTVPLEYLPAGAITPKIGMTLQQSGGLLAAATGTTKPTYVCMTESASALTSGTVIPVMRVAPDIVWRTSAQAAMTSVNRGDKVTIYTDGLQVTATTTSGVAEVVGMDGTAAGSDVYVRFP